MKFSNGSFLKLGETLETMKNRDLRKYTIEAHDRYSAKEIAMEVSSRKLNLTWDTMLAEGTYEELWDMYRGDGEPGLADAMGMSERQFAKAYTAAGENIKKMIQNYLSKNVDEAMVPKDPNSVEVRVGNDINDILNGALDGQDMSDQIDALSQKWLGGNEIEDDSGMHDAIRLVVYTHKKEPADQAEAAEEALSMIDNPTEAQNIDRIRELAGLR